jgi:aspartate carbamoyltransferase catalytic subunit
MEARKDLLDISSLRDEEIHFVLDNSGPFRELFQRSVKKVPSLRGQTVLTLFYEPSTRTRSSFEIAASRMSADVTHFSVANSSVTKGESVLDTVATLEAMRTDYVIVRHARAGIPNLIARQTKASVINAGDGFHAHPTQALLDAFTARDVMGDDLAGKRALIVGDVAHSRVARSTSTLFRRLGMEVAVLGPGTLIPAWRPEWLQRRADWTEALAWKPDLIYLLRVQRERQTVAYFPSVGEYHRRYGLTVERLREVRERGLWVMHPGPVNRGVELTDEVMSYERCLIDKQVENGIAVRMAVLYWLRPESELKAGTI